MLSRLEGRDDTRRLADAIVVIVVTVILMVTERAPAPCLLLVAVTTLLVVGVIETSQAFAGLLGGAATCPRAQLARLSATRR